MNEFNAGQESSVSRKRWPRLQAISLHACAGQSHHARYKVGPRLEIGRWRWLSQRLECQVEPKVDLHPHAIVSGEHRIYPAASRSAGSDVARKGSAPFARLPVSTRTCAGGQQQSPLVGVNGHANHRTAPFEAVLTEAREVVPAEKKLRRLRHIKIDRMIEHCNNPYSTLNSTKCRLIVPQ